MARKPNERGTRGGERGTVRLTHRLRYFPEFGSGTMLNEVTVL